eukprot:scaffold58834_cov18-Tisochrysis_lutea.AAC.4
MVWARVSCMLDLDPGLRQLREERALFDGLAWSRLRCHQEREALQLLVGCVRGQATEWGVPEESCQERWLSEG